MLYQLSYRFKDPPPGSSWSVRACADFPGSECPGHLVNARVLAVPACPQVDLWGRGEDCDFLGALRDSNPRCLLEGRSPEPLDETRGSSVT